LKNKNLKTVILFFVLTFTFLILYKDVFLKREVIVPGDIPYNTPIWQGEAPDQKYYNAGNYLLSDQINQFYVWHHLAHVSMMGTGEIPLWNPYIFAGHPLVADSQSSLFYLPNLLLYYFGPGTVATMRAFFNILIIVVFGFLLGRQLGISRMGAVMISASLSLCGPVTVWLGHPHANVFSWFPFLMWSGGKIFGSEKKILWSGIFGIGAGISILGGHPETAFHMFMVLSVYFFSRIVILIRKNISIKKTSILLITGLMLGVLISSVQLIPFSDFLFHSSTFSGGGRGDHGGPLLWSGSAPGNITGIATLIYPDFFGNPPDRTFRDPVKSVLNYNEQAIYFGLIPISFLFLIIFRKGNPPFVKILIFISLASLGVAWRLPFFEVFNHLPVFSFVSNGRLKIFFVFISIILSGYGFDLFRAKIRQVKPGKRIALKFAVLPIVAVFVFLIFSIMKSFFLLSGFVPYKETASKLPFLKYLTFRIFSPGNIGVMMTLFTAIMILIFVLMLIKNLMGTGTFEVLLIILSIIDLAVPAMRYNPTIKKEDILPFPQVFSELKSDGSPFRIIADDSIKIQNYNAVHGIQLMGGYDLPVYGKYGDLFLTYNRGNVHNHNWQENSELIDFLNVKYYFNKGVTTPISSKYKLIFDNLNYRIYENTNVFPRAFMVYDYKVISDGKKSLEYLKENDFRLRDEVILNTPPEVQFEKFSSSSGVANSVKFDFYNSDSVQIDIFTEKDGILVMSDILMPGWDAIVDGRKKKILSANYTFRGVYISAGNHKVTFKYEPSSYTAGVFLSYTGIFISVLFIILGVMKKWFPGRSVYT